VGKFLDAAELVLKQYKTPLTANELAEKARDLRHLDFCSGKTPDETMRARISVDIRTKGVSSRFKRTEPGHFALREWDSTEYHAKPRVKSISLGEQVLVARRDLIRKVGYFHGITKNYAPYVSVLLDSSNASFVPRVDAETDTSLKQVLSYVILRTSNKVLRFQRGNYTNVESFLKGRYSIGFGGHVRSPDISVLPYADMGYSASVIRELREELRLPGNEILTSPPPVIAVLNDDSSDVGQSHIAFVHLLDLPSADVRKNEKSINRLAFVPIEEIGTEIEHYEYWSRLCVSELFGDSVKINPIMKQRSRSNPFQKRVIIVVGSVGSGKTRVCKLLSDRYEYNVLSSSAILCEMLGLPSVHDMGRRKMQDISYEFIRSPGGPETLAQSILGRMKDHRARYVIDGIRNRGTYLELKRLLGKELGLIYVERNPEDALEYYEDREDRTISPQEFFEILAHPVEKEIPSFALTADAILYNYGATESFVGVIEDYLKRNP
jgi:predicted NUDIX family phosphoesterase/dephospho-CoA kinase